MTTDTITIRTARPGDLSAADALYAASYPALLKGDYPPSVLVLALPLISKAQPRLLASGTYYVAEDETGRLVAAGGWTRAAPQGAGTHRHCGHVRHVVTDHRMVRRGIGRRLMQHILRTASEAGIRSLQCQSTRTAVPFYKACGFRELAPVEVPLRPGITFPAIAMERDL